MHAHIEHSQNAFPFLDTPCTEILAMGLTATRPAQQPAGAAAESEYCHLVDVFSAELKKAGMKENELQELVQSVHEIWVASSSYKVTHENHPSLLVSCKAVIGKERGQELVGSMVRLFVQRALIAAGLHHRILESFLSQETVTDNTGSCLRLLLMMMEQPDDPNAKVGA